MMFDELFEKYRRDRDRRIFAQIVAKHRPLVASVCQRLLRDPNDVEDVIQETFLTLTRNIDSLQGSITAWLMSIAQAGSVDLIRRSVRERNRRLKLAQLGSQQVEYLAARELIRLRLHDAMLALDPAAHENRVIR